MGTHSDDFEFVQWAMRQKQFRWNTSNNAARFLMERSGARGLSNVVSCVNGHDLLATDIYELLRLSEPEAWSAYCAYVEDYEETQARIDNARGKRY